MGSAIRWLHLTDLHVGMDDQCRRGCSPHSGSAKNGQFDQLRRPRKPVA